MCLSFFLIIGESFEAVVLLLLVFELNVAVLRCEDLSLILFIIKLFSSKF